MKRCFTAQREAQMPLLYRIARLRSGEDSGLCRVKRICDTGILLVTAFSTIEGQIVEIILSETIVVSARVVAVEGARLLLRFADPFGAAQATGLLAAGPVVPPPPSVIEVFQATPAGATAGRR